MHFLYVEVKHTHSIRIRQLGILTIRTKAAIKLVSGSHLVSLAGIRTMLPALQAEMLLGAMVVTTMVTTPMEEMITEATIMAMAALLKATMAMVAMVLVVGLSHCTFETSCIKHDLAT